MPEWSGSQTRAPTLRPHYWSQNRASSMHQGSAPFAPDPEQNQCADDRHDESGRMKRGSWCWSREQPSNQPSNNGSGDAENHRQQEPHLESHERFRDPTDNETDNDRPNDV